MTKLTTKYRCMITSDQTQYQAKWSHYQHKCPKLKASLHTIALPLQVSLLALALPIYGNVGKCANLACLGAATDLAMIHAFETSVPGNIELIFTLMAMFPCFCAYCATSLAHLAWIWDCIIVCSLCTRVQCICFLIRIHIQQPISIPIHSHRLSICPVITYYTILHVLFCFLWKNYMCRVYYRKIVVCFAKD